MAYPYYFAKFYDLIYHQMRSGTDMDFFMNKISQINGTILEIGTGTGRFFAEALKNNANIYGIDISPEMINVLKTKIDSKYHPRISLQSITNFKFDFKFDLIIAPFRVFMHLLDTNDQLEALNNVYDHLTENGIFIFDLYVPNLDIIKNGLNNVVDFDEEYEPGKKLKRTVSANSDIINQISDIKMKLDWDDDSGQRSEEWNLKLRFFFRYEIEHLISLSKLKLVKILGDYNENELNKDSKDFIVICKK